MGLFDFLKPKSESYDIETLLIGYLRIEISKILGFEVNSMEFKEARKNVGESIKVVLVPMLNKSIQQEVLNTISSVCKNRPTEVFGEYMVFLYCTNVVIKEGLPDGKFPAEFADIDVVNNFVYHQIKGFISKAKNSTP